MLLAFLVALFLNQGVASDIPNDLPPDVRSELSLLHLGSLRSESPESIKKYYCPDGLSDQSRLWLLTRVRDAVALSAMNDFRAERGAQEKWNAIQAACNPAMFPNLNKCMKRALDYSETIAQMSKETNNSPEKAQLPNFIRNDQQLLNKLIYLKDIEEARTLLQKKAPQCITYKFWATIDAGTYPNSRGRLFLRCPEGNSIKYMTVSYRSDPESDNDNPIGNISVVEESVRNGKTEAWYADYKRLPEGRHAPRRDSPVTFERNTAKQNCATCHPSGALSINRMQVDPKHLQDWRKAQNARTRDYVYTPNTSGQHINFSNLGPAVGEDMGAATEQLERSDKFFRDCVEQIPGANSIPATLPQQWETTKTKLRKYMKCDSCHTDTPHAMAGFAPTLRGNIPRTPVFVGAIWHGPMPLGAGDDIDQDLAKLLMLCINFEYYGGVDPDRINTQSQGKLYKWLTEIDCKTGRPRTESGPTRSKIGSESN